jgi:hypothetical protein
MTKEKCGIEKSRLFMDITYKYNHTANQINKHTTYFKIYCQNIWGIGKKASELLSHLHPHFQHVLCLMEHNLNYLQFNYVHIEDYNLGAYYCGQQHEKGSVVIFV